jgi:c-di-GMP-binding flagellar brake protein YcgR
MMEDGIIENDWTKEEKRQYKREDVTFCLPVYDQETNTLLGQVLEIGQGGMRLISQEPIPVGKHFHLSLGVSLESGQQERVFLEARSVWSQEDDNPDSFATGFQFRNLPQEIARRIQKEQIRQIVKQCIR